MFSYVINVLFSVITILITSHTCTSELSQSLYLFSPGEVEYTEVIVRRLHDNLTLVCELRGDNSKRDYVWNFMPGNVTQAGSPQPLTAEPASEAPHRSTLVKHNLTVADSGRYMCSSPPFSQTKYILVQTTIVKHCARGAFSCGARCVLPAYVCDGRRDCLAGEDEAPRLCRHQPCNGPDKLNCSSGRCVPAAACCAHAQAAPATCAQPACCDEHSRYSRLQATFDDFPLPPEDRHSPDDYGFIQSTIYTVTACALIFMIAVVLLVSAICKMHMKRAALRGYAAAATLYPPCAQTHRFPPCYESSRLLDQEGRLSTPLDSPTNRAMQCAVEAPNSPDVGFGLGRLSDIFSTRYRQVPTQCYDVEMRSLPPSPRRLEPRGPADFHSMATPVEYFRRRALERPRPYTLQLGRFQLSLPKLARAPPGRPAPPARPDTPNVGELDVGDIDFVRLTASDTYTLNGRTIRLLGADFENYPVLPDGSVQPPTYTEAVRYKLIGPPPEYLSRDGLDVQNVSVDEEARNNVEMPPNYEELGDAAVASGSGVGNGTSTAPGIRRMVTSVSEDSVSDYVVSAIPGTGSILVASGDNNNMTQPTTTDSDDNSNNCYNTSVPGTSNGCNVNNNVVESMSSVIDNLPAIDSDVNANEAEA